MDAVFLTVLVLVCYGAGVGMGMWYKRPARDRNGRFTK